MSPLNRVFQRGCWLDPNVRASMYEHVVRDGTSWMNLNRILPSLYMHASTYSRACEDEEKEEARLLPYCGGVEPLTYCRTGSAVRAQWPTLMD